MVSSNHVTSASMVLFVLLVSTSSVFAKSWVPDEDYVVFTYDKNIVNTNNPSSNKTFDTASSEQVDDNLKQIETLIYNSRLPGKSSNLTPAKLRVKQLKVQKNQLSEIQKNRLLLAQANLAQQSHRFEQAFNYLNQISIDSYLFPQTLLIKARVQQIQANYIAAEKSCKQLLSKQTQVAQLCLLETRSHQGQESDVYKTLKFLEPRYQQSTDGFKRFFYQVKGTAARLNNDFISAQKSFSFNLDSAPASQWYQWSDMSFKNKNAQMVYDRISKLSNTLTDSSSLEDGFIVRLARAEKLLGISKDYQRLAKQRIELRILREDTLHAADIAYYYLYVSPNKEKALQWARLNWSSVKEPSDKELLQQAESINNQ